MAARDRPRLVDLAERLDVAPSTVSRALAGSSSVSRRTRERVLRAARELGYTPNLTASGLKRGQTLNIGLISVMSYWYAGAVASGADRVAAAAGYDFVVMSAVDGRDRELLLQRARRLGRRADGVLVNDVQEGELLDELIDAVGVPVVTLGCRTPGVSSVEVDNLRIGACVADHFALLGHESAVVLSSQNPSPLAFDNASVRAEGFRARFGSGAAVPEHLALDEAADRQRLLVDAVDGASAVFCTADALAIEAVSALRQADRPVPCSISVVGVDDHPLAAPLGLTTVAQSPEDMGEIATRQLLAEIDGDAEVTAHQVATRLRVRSTSGAV